MPLQLNDYVLLALLVLAVIFDLTKKKIPNFLTFPVIAWGLGSYTLTGKLDGFFFSSLGLLAGLGLLLIPFALGGMGGGDVKLLAAVGALKGGAFVVNAALFTALCGGVMAVLALIASGRLLPVLRKLSVIIARPLLAFAAIRLRNPALLSFTGMLTVPEVCEQGKPSPAVPYGVAIALGAVLALSGLLKCIEFF
jgi:prepilin peptidase CpaA